MKQKKRKWNYNKNYKEIRLSKKTKYLVNFDLIIKKIKDDAETKGIFFSERDLRGFLINFFIEMTEVLKETGVVVTPLGTFKLTEIPTERMSVYMKETLGYKPKGLVRDIEFIPNPRVYQDLKQAKFYEMEGILSKEIENLEFPEEHI